jgi:uncharacterized protein
MDRALRFGADVNFRGSYAGRTPLMVAAIHGRTEVARFLLSRGADPRLTDQKGFTALALARRSKKRETARLLEMAAK